MKKLLSDLIAFKSITPNDAGAIEYCETFLKNLGFSCEILQFNNTKNLYAKLGNFEKTICFAGHLDVVPAVGNWKFDPFKMLEKDGLLFGRGANDMKGPLAACFSAIRRYISSTLPAYSISILLTSDEEIMGEDGTAKVIEFLLAKNEKISGCVLCESCSPYESAGGYIKIGCRGSLNIDLEASGTQCHVASFDVFGNTIHDFITFLNELIASPIDEGNEHFSPTRIQITSLDSRNDVRNIIPQKISAKLNIRFNNIWNFETLEEFIIKKLPPNVEAKFERFGEPFIGASDSFVAFLSNSVTKTTGATPDIGTIGGNSDAVSIRNLCDVVEIGSPLRNAHIVDEYIEIKDLEKLELIYYGILKDFDEFLKDN